MSIALFKKKSPPSERRQYIRIDTVFPVQFRLLSADSKHFLSEWLQGFTNNIGKGGICLDVNNLNPELAVMVKAKQAKFSLDIETPVNHMPIGAQASVRWVKTDAEEPNKYCIGLMYDNINKLQNSQIMRYAWTKKLFFPAVLSIIIMLSSGSIINTIISAKLIKGNKILIEQLIKILQESSVAKQKVKEINKEKQELLLKIQALSARIQNVEEETQKQQAQETVDSGKTNAYIKELLSQRESLQQELISLQRKESVITEDLLRLDKRKMALEKTNLEKMYRWLKGQQNQRTGLVSSFQSDKEISNLAYTYDQALAALAFTYFSDSLRASMIFKFFQTHASRLDGSFLNVYYAAEGKPAEYSISRTSNIWLGIAIAHYTKKSGDNRYLGLAEEIAKLLIYLQNNNKEGSGIPAVAGKEDLSIEEDLDAYVFFDILHGLTRNQLYLDAREKTLGFLMARCADKISISPKLLKENPHFAMDTYAWAIAAIGPQKLEELGFSADRILEFTEENCARSAQYLRGENEKVKITGFDFASGINDVRGGIVSSESTARMVLLYKIMTDYYYRKGMVAKARSYESKADMYLAELANMITLTDAAAHADNSLPYATQDNVDTGHGWMTPKGDCRGSVAATVYTLFAYYNFNPLELE